MTKRNLLMMLALTLILISGMLAYNAATVASAITPTPSKDRTSAPIYVFVRGADGLLYYRYERAGTWVDWRSISTPDVGATGDTPAVTVQPDGTIDLFVRGGDDQLWHRTYTPRIEKWSAWEALGGKLTSGASAVVMPAGN